MLKMQPFELFKLRNFAQSKNTVSLPKKSWFWNQEWLVIKANSMGICNWSALNKLFGYLKRIKTSLFLWKEAKRRKTLTCWERGNNTGKLKQANAWSLYWASMCNGGEDGTHFSLMNSIITAYDIKLDHLFKKEVQKPRSYVIDLNTPL